MLLLLLLLLLLMMSITKVGDAVLEQNDTGDTQNLGGAPRERPSRIADRHAI